MAEIKWYVIVSYDYLDADRRESFHVFRAYSWQDAFDSVRKDVYRDRCWSLYPLERDGTYHSALNAFRVVESGPLRQAGFEPRPTRDP